ncbi:MAG: hypothetical protein AB7E51_02520 [Pseudodesulfovibrio sp.]|uniref:hypothetical protein n=1 Tax=Pseudodesulfovibrio sp. TaxID=2035812 RepID=UPI003D0EB1BF
MKKIKKVRLADSGIGWKRISLTMCLEAREILEIWNGNGIALPTALATCVRVVYDDDSFVDKIERGDFETVTFLLSDLTRADLGGLAKRWGVSRSEAADMAVLGIASVIRGENTLRVSLADILPLDTGAGGGEEG